jgi:putative DNA primase/helicase
MITIPSQLSNQRFILLADKNKPLQKQWQSFNNHEMCDNVFQEFLRRDNMVYGVPTGFNNLIVLDFDDKDAQDKLFPLLPITFSVFSANKRFYHLYFFTDNVTGRRFDDKTSGKRLLDLQGRGQYVVGPNSVLSSGKRYDVAFDAPIATLYKADLDAALEKAGFDFSEVDNFSKGEKHHFDSDLSAFMDPLAVKIKKTLKISQLLNRFSIAVHKNPTMCPLGHESISKSCFSFDDDKNDGVWHCFHCGESGDVITLYQKLYGLGGFSQTKNAMFKELFIKEQEYEESLKNINATAHAKKTPGLSAFEVNEIAQVMVNHFLFVTIAETDKMLYYDKRAGVYKRLGEQEIMRELEAFFSDLMKTHIAVEIINKIKRLTHQSISVFDNHKNLICLRNGVFNFETKILLPHSPDYYFVNSLPIVYNHLSECPRVHKFFSEVYEKNPQLLIEICAFLLLKHNRHEKAVIIVGSGRNGKSVFLSLCKNFVGEENVSAKSLQNLSEDRFATSGLFGKMANISADIPNKRIINSDAFKMLVSGKDLIDAQFKNENSFKFVNNAKLLFSCNALPAAQDQTDGYLRKWCILQFNRVFEGAEENKFLLEELCAEDELSGLFNECVRCYDKVNIKGLDYTENVEQMRELYNNLADPIADFLEEACALDGLSEINFSEFESHYAGWCLEHDVPAPSGIMLGKALRARGVRINKTSVIRDGRRSTQNVVFGYCWAEDVGKDTLIIKNEEVKNVDSQN